MLTRLAWRVRVIGDLPSCLPCNDETGPEPPDDLLTLNWMFDS